MDRRPCQSRALCTVGRVCLWGVLLAGSVAPGSAGGQEVARQEAGTLRALKYHQVLVRRPEPGYLFDRFYNTWLDEAAVDSLEQFLAQRATETKETADQLLLAFFYVKKGDDVAALERFHAALAANPASAATLYHKATVEARTLDFDTAISDLRKAREQKPDEKLSLLIDKQLGRLLVRNRRSAEALQVWQELLTAHPDDDELAEDLVELHIDEGLFKEGAALAEKLVARTKDPYLAVMRRLRLGDIHHRAGDRDKAIATYTSALDEVGSGTWLEREILAQVDQILRREDDLTGLQKLYEELEKKYAKRIAIRRRHAQLLVELNENDAAVAAFHEVMKLTPGDRATREEYVDMLAKIGRHDEAITELRALCQQHAKDAELRFRLAGLLHDAKKSDEAVQAADDYLAASDRSEYAYLRAARLLERFESFDAADRLYSDMAEKFADSASAQEAYAAFLYARGNKDDAKARWQALSENADVGQVLHIARALAARNEQQAALALLKKRQQEFAKEPLYLGQLATTAFALKKFDEAIPWTLARVKLAREVAGLEAAVDQAAAVIERADKLEEIAARLESQPRRSIPEMCLLAELCERAGDSARADKALAEPAAAGNLLAASEQIRLQSQRRDWTAAADATRRILELPGGRKSLYVRRLVELYQRDFQLEEGLKWIDEWKRLSPGSTTPWTTEARLLSGLGRTEDALKTLRTAALRFEDDEDLRVRLAEFYSQSEKPADAERIYWQLYEETEDLGGKLRWAQELAKIAQQRGTVQQLAENFNDRAANNRRSIAPLLSLSEVYRVTDDYEGRRRALTAAAKVKPDDMYLLMQIARVEEQDGDWQAAVRTLERALPLDKTNRTREQIAQLHLQYGEEETGFAMLMDLVSGKEADPRSLETVADALCAMQEWQRAADFLQARSVEHPGDYRLRFLLAVALEEAGQTDAALAEFVDLLDNQHELPTKKTTALRPPTVSSYMDMMRQLLPAQACQWYEVLQSRYSAYQHRQQGAYGGVRLTASMSRAPGVTVMRSGVQMPPNLEGLRPLALAHALSITALLDEQQQREACRQLAAHGVEHADSLSQIDPNRGDFTTVVADVLEKNPDNEAALAMLAMQAINRDDETLAPKYARAVEKFRESRPQLAFMAAVQAGIHEARAAEFDVGESDAESSDGEAADGAQANMEQPSRKIKHFDIALALAADVDQPNPMVVIGVTNILGRQGAATSAIGESYRQKFSKLMVDWYPKLTASPYGSYAFQMVVQSLSQNEDPAAYVQFMDDEISRFQASGNPNTRGSSPSMAMYYGRGRQSMLTPLAFPPPQLADFPPNVLALFATNQMDPFGRPTVRPGGDLDAAKKIEALLPKVKSPILQILLAHSAELNKFVDASIATLLSRKTPSIDAYLIAAARASEQEDFVKVVELLEKARYLPMNQDMRRQVDSGTVAAALAVKDDKTKASDELLEAGRQASLRLRRARLDAQQRSELIAAMEDLGLKKEAKKLDELAAAAPASSGGAPFVYSGGAYAVASGPAGAGVDRVSKLVADGQTDAAVRMLKGEVSAQVQRSLGNMQSMRSYRYEFRNLRRRIEGLNLAKEVLKSLEPGDTRNVRRIAEYAMVCQIFGNDHEARNQYERALEIRPKDDASRMQLILLAGANDPDETAKQIKLLSPTSRDQFGQLLSEEFGDYETPVADRIRKGSLVVQFIESLTPGDVTQPYWVENILTVYGRQMYSNRGRSLPSLYSTADDSRSNGDNIIDKALLVLRQKVHADLCMALLDKPELARVGFRHFLAVAEAQKLPMDEFVERAQKILLDEAAAPAHKTPLMRQQVYYSSNDSDEVRLRSPEEFLAQRAFKNGDWTLIDDTLLPKLTGGRSGESRRQLEQLAMLYRCDESDFLAHAEEAVRRFRPTNPQQENEALAIAVDVWADRKLKVDLRPLVLKQLKQDVNSPNHHRPPRYVLRLLTAPENGWDHERRLSFLDEVATIYIGPRDKRNDFLRKNNQRNMIQWGTPNGRIYVFRQLMQQLCQQPKLWYTVLEHLEGYEAPPVDNLQYSINEGLNRAVGKGAKEAMSLLESSPWLRNVPEFRPLALGGAGENGPLVSLLNHLQAGGKEAVRDEFRKLLRTRQAATPTFGGGLMLAYLDQSDKKPTLVLDFLGGQLDAIGDLPQDRQLALATLVQHLIRPEALSRSDLGEPARAAKEWVIGGRTAHSREMLARLGKVKQLEDLGVQYGQVHNFLRQNMREMVKTDPASAAKMLFRLGELARDSQRRGQWYMHFGGGESTTGWLLQQTAYGLNFDDWSAYNFLVDVVRNDEKTPIEVANAATHIGGSSLTAALARATKKLAGSRPPGMAPPIDERIYALYEECGPALDGRPSSLLAPGFCDRLRSELDRKACIRIRSWAKKEVEHGKYPQLAADLDAAVELIAEEKREIRQRRKTGKDARRPDERREMADYHRHFLHLIKNEELPLTWRLFLAEYLAGRQGDSLPTELAQASIEVFSEALAAKAPIVGRQNDKLVEIAASLADEPSAAELVATCRAKWAERYLRPRRPTTGRPMENLDDAANSGSICRSLEMYLAADEAEHVEKLLRKYDGQIGSLPQTLAILARAKRPQQAANLLRRNWGTLELPWPNTPTTRHDAALAEALPAVYERFERDDQRYFAQLFFASMPDVAEASADNAPNSEKPVKTEQAARDKRLQELASRFADVKFADAAMKKRALVILSSSDATRDAMSANVAGEYQIENLVSAFQGGDGNPRLDQEMQLATSHLRNRLAADDYAPLVELLKRLCAAPSEDDYSFGQRLSPLLKFCSEMLGEADQPWSRRQCADVAGALRGIFKDRQNFYFDDYNAFNSLLLALHSQAGDIEATEKWLTTITEEGRSQMQGQGLSEDVWKFGLRLNHPASAENLDARLRFTENALRFAAARKWIRWSREQPYEILGIGNRQFFFGIVKSGLLTQSELKQHGAGLVENVGDSDLVSAAWAAWLQSIKEFDQAAAAWQVVVASNSKAADDEERSDDNKRPAANLAELRVSHVLGLAESLEKVGKVDEARTALAGLEKKKIPESMKADVDEMVKKLAKTDATKEKKSSSADRSNDSQR